MENLPAHHPPVWKLNPLLKYCRPLEKLNLLLNWEKTSIKICFVQLFQADEDEWTQGLVLQRDFS